MTDLQKYLPPAESITVFTTPWCGYCRTLKQQLTAQNISYREINIEATPDAAQLVEHVNGGNQTVPTVIYPDGTAATNPSLLEVRTTLGHLNQE